MTPSFLTLIEDDLKTVEGLILEQAEGYHPILGEALQTLMNAGGKRIRPAISLLIGRILGVTDPNLVMTAAGIELLHTATLVHDDLIDNALFRRGHPTLNARWSPAATVLTGDFLFARSADMIARTANLEMIRAFSNTLSIIVNGEVHQLFSDRFQYSRESYQKRIYAKTASLFEVAAEAPAYYVSSPAEWIEPLRHFGYHLGMAFQMVDDILDFTGEQVKLGKPVGGDLRHGIITLPAIIFLEQNPGFEAWANLTEGKGEREEQVTMLLAAINESGAMSMAMGEARGEIQTAIGYLRRLPAGPARDGLEAVANMVVERSV
ncbi:MAG TPA: polyprenyl synthetase family protein [Anaerolineaceae bacterium]|nr:polyprenyl synthetase family protein [Anaerolineaceae bacterium]HPN52929.1 polyprenyl synthetase family protein [Anaerolineaceae bacterium]